jgi:hypothetical protein
MIDLEAHYRCARKLVGYQDLTQVLEPDRVVIEQGDMVCLRTGFAQVLLEMDRSPDPTVVHNVCAGLDGRDDRLQQWVTDSGLAALISIARWRWCRPGRATLTIVRRFPARALSVPTRYQSGRDVVSDRTGGLAERVWAVAFPAHRSPVAAAGAVGSPATPVATV